MVRPRTIAEELEELAKDCEDTAKEAQLLQGDSTTTGEQRAWLSVAYRIRYIAKRAK